MDDREYDLLIIGGGPAGFAAGIYAGRSGLKTAILEKQMVGGQVIESPLIENWPGIKEISGPDLVMKMREHAEQYVSIIEFTEAVSIRKDGLFTVGTNNGEYRSKAVIFTTGAKHRHLGVKGEDRFSGKGVSYCATCDGFFFKDRDVMVVGGGSTALLYAIYLNNIGCRVKIVHRRDEFRGEKALQDQIRKLPIELIMNSVVEEFKGDDLLSEVVLRNVKNGEIKEVPVAGVFIAVGEDPQTKLAAELGVELDERGFIKVDRSMKTNVPGVFAAGDATGGLMQIVAATGEGAQAATSAFEELMEPYWL